MADSANVPHDGAIDRSATANALPPTRMGAKSQDSLPTAVSADGDCVDLVATRQGQLRVKVDEMPTVTTTLSSLPSTTTGVSRTIDVTDQSTLALAADSTAKGWLLTNNGSSAIYVVLGATAVSGVAAAANGGHYVGASGGTIGMGQLDGYNGAVSVICASGATSVAAVSRW